MKKEMYTVFMEKNFHELMKYVRQLRREYYSVV